MRTKISTLIARAGLTSAPVTAFAPVVGTILTGHGTSWLVLPVGSVIAFAGGTCGERRAALNRRQGVVISEPSLNAVRDAYATAPRDQITVEYHWSKEDAA